MKKKSTNTNLGCMILFWGCILALIIYVGMSKDGPNRILKQIGGDSGTSVVYVQDGDTLALDNLTIQQYDSLTNVLNK